MTTPSPLAVAPPPNPLTPREQAWHARLARLTNLGTQFQAWSARSKRPALADAYGLVAVTLHAALTKSDLTPATRVHQVIQQVSLLLISPPARKDLDVAKLYADALTRVAECLLPVSLEAAVFPTPTPPASTHTKGRTH